jgi:pyruvate/2-oxoglutarate dehydrogenase complex dihydrolipoamide dehydrogenase (E3) component
MGNCEIAGHLETYKASGTELIMCTARFAAPKTVEVRLNDGGQRQLTDDRIFRNVGSHAAMPNVPGLAAAMPLTHIEVPDLDYAPSPLVVLGGGYVGLELAQAHDSRGSGPVIGECAIALTL